MRDARNLNDIYAIPPGLRIWGERITVYADTSTRNGTYELVYNSHSTSKSDNLNWIKVGSGSLTILNGVSYTALSNVAVASGTLFSAISLPSTVSVLMDNGLHISIPVTWSIGSYDKNTPATYAISGSAVLTNYPYISVSNVTFTINVIVS